MTTASLVADVVRAVPLARQAMAGAVYPTPFEHSIWPSELTGARIGLKLECYQPTGSFKVRGALAAIAQLDNAARARGVVTASAGNHGLGVAYAASRAGVRATVVTPDEASPAKLSALRRFPIELLRGGSSYDTAERRAREIEQETGATFVSPYNDPWVIAGQGTIGQELLEDEPELDVVLVPVGGGGLLSGIGAWIKSHRPATRIIGVQSVASPAMHRAVNLGRLIEIEVLPTLADGLAANIEVGSRTFDIVQTVIDDFVLVSEDEIADTVRLAFHDLHLALEGSAVVGIAALLHDRIPNLEDKQVGVVITGRNIAAERLCELLGVTTH